MLSRLCRDKRVSGRSVFHVGKKDRIQIRWREAETLSRCFVRRCIPSDSGNDATTMCTRGREIANVQARTARSFPTRDRCAFNASSEKETSEVAGQFGKCYCVRSTLSLSLSRARAHVSFAPVKRNARLTRPLFARRRDNVFSASPGRIII